jgi:uncharacterized protein (TIGR00369 family)
MTGPQLTTEAVHDLMPFAASLGIQLVSASAEESVCRMAWRKDLTTVADGFHGGALMALADSTGGIVAFLNLPEGAGTSTISSNTVFLRAAREGVVTATARRVHAGRSTVVVETTVCDENGRPLTRTTQTQAVLETR